MYQRSLRLLFSVGLVFAVAVPLVSALPQAPVCAVEASSRCGRCGDGQCVKQCGETALSCPADCGVPAEQ